LSRTKPTWPSSDANVHQRSMRHVEDNECNLSRIHGTRFRSSDICSSTDRSPPNSRHQNEYSRSPACGENRLTASP
jgi:hypothetical protein